MWCTLPYLSHKLVRIKFLSEYLLKLSCTNYINNVQVLLCVHSSIAIMLMGKRELIALLNLSSWCLVMVEQLFLAVPRGCLQFVIVVFPDHTHLLFLIMVCYSSCQPLPSLYNLTMYKDNFHKI